METTRYTVRIQPAAEGGYWAEVPALPGCFTRGETLEEVTAYVREAIELRLAELLRAGRHPPVEKSARRSFAFPVTVRMPRLA